MVEHQTVRLKRKSDNLYSLLIRSGSVRRSSVFPRQSMAPGVSTAYKTPQETRPVKNLQFQEQCRVNVHQYLLDIRCPYPMNAKTLTSPTQKEFQNLVQYLVQILFEGGFAWAKTFEMDCNTLLKDLKYPGLEACGKTALGAPGTPLNWPPMLAMLNWLVDLCKVSTLTEVEDMELMIGPRYLEDRTCRPDAGRSRFITDRSPAFARSDAMGPLVKDIPRMVRSRSRRLLSRGTTT